MAEKFDQLQKHKVLSKKMMSLSKIRCHHFAAAALGSFNITFNLMTWKRQIETNWYTWLEIAFFLVFFFLFPVLTDIEYGLYEPVYSKYEMSFADKLIFRLVFGVFEVIPYYLLYRYAIIGLLIKKKYGYFILAFLLFLIFLQLYTHFCTYWLVSKMIFLPVSIIDSANNWFHAKTPVHFSIIYVVKQALQFTALAYFINYSKQEKRINALKEAKLEADLSILKAQIHPHFFFNTLNNIYALALEKSEHTATLVAQLADMMRYVIYEAASARVSLAKETAFLQNYVAIEAIRYTDKIAIKIDTQGINEVVYIEPLLLLPFIENVFKHGIQDEMTSGFAEIIIVLHHKQLTLQTRNSTPNLKKEPSAAGIGLDIARKRLNLLYPGKHNLQVSVNDDVYEVLLNLQLN